MKAIHTTAAQNMQKVGTPKKFTRDLLLSEKLRFLAQKLGKMWKNEYNSRLIEPRWCSGKAAASWPQGRGFKSRLKPNFFALSKKSEEKSFCGLIDFR